MAASEASVPPSVGSVPHQGSGSSGPCVHSSSGGSRHPINTLKKWLTNPVRKLSSDSGGRAGKVDKQMCWSDRRQPLSLLSHSETQLRPLVSSDNYTILTSGDTVRLQDRQTRFIYTSYVSKHILDCCLLCPAGYLTLLQGRVTHRAFTPARLHTGSQT